MQAAGVSLLCRPPRHEHRDGGRCRAGTREEHRCLGGAASCEPRREEDVHAALLVNYTEFNTRLAPVAARARDPRRLVRRAADLGVARAGGPTTSTVTSTGWRSCSPSRSRLWCKHGVDAHYVGHPAREVSALSRSEARQALGLPDLASTVAILPGSRPHEVRALLEPMLEAVDRVRRDRASVEARVLIAPSLDRATRDSRPRQARTKSGVSDLRRERLAGGRGRAPGVRRGADGVGDRRARGGARARRPRRRLPGRPRSPRSWRRALVRTPLIALPNVLLGRRAFPELLQRDVTPAGLAAAVARSLDGPARPAAACDEVEAVLGERRTPAREVAAMLLPWIAAPVMPLPGWRGHQRLVPGWRAP